MLERASCLHRYESYMFKRKLKLALNHMKENQVIRCTLLKNTVVPSSAFIRLFLHWINSGNSASPALCQALKDTTHGLKPDSALCSTVFQGRYADKGSTTDSCLRRGKHRERRGREQKPLLGEVWRCQS